MPITFKPIYILTPRIAKILMRSKKSFSLKGYFPGRKRDEHAVRGYYSALAQLEQYG